MSGHLDPDVLDGFIRRCQTEWAAAGLPDHIEDPAVLARVAHILLTAPATVPGSHQEETT